MRESTYQISANVPDIDDFAVKYPHYRNFAEGEGQSLFEMILTPDNLNSAVEVTRLGFPAILAVAEDTYQAVLKDAASKGKNYY